MTDDCIFCGPNHPNGLRHSDAEIRAYERGRAGRSSDSEPAPRYPIRFAGDGGPDTDDWTCSCGLTRPVTGSYGCADCGDGRPDSWERVGAVPALQTTGEPSDELREAASEMLLWIETYDDAMGHGYCAKQSGEYTDPCTCGFDEKRDRWRAAIEGAGATGGGERHE